MTHAPLAPRASIGLVLLLLGASLLVASAQGATAPAAATQNCNLATNLGSDDDLARFGENRGRIFLGASSATEPFLSLDASASKTDKFQVGDNTAGLTKGVGEVQGTLPAPVLFPLKGAWPTTYFLNLSKPIIATVFVSTTTETSGKDLFQLRFELWQGAVRVGGQECFTTLAAATPAWFAFQLRFRPEVGSLDSGQPLTLKIYQMSSLTDVQIGTGSPHQSFFEYRYFGSDPLAGPVFIKDGKRQGGSAPESNQQSAPLGPVASEAGSQGGAGGPVAMAMATSFGLLGLVAVHRSPLRGRAALVALVMVFVVPAGCLGGKSHAGPSGTGDATDSPKSTATQTVEENQTLQEEGHGALEGTVRDDLGIVVPKTHVLILGTSLSRDTDSKGFFEFANMTAGTYLLRADHDGFLSLEENITIEVGKKTILDITLARPAVSSNNLAPHTHDDFNGDPKKQLYDLDVPMTTSKVGPAGSVNGWHCYYADRCETMVPFDASVRVPPGTSSIEVLAKFTNTGFQQVGLRVLTPLNKTPELAKAGGINQDFVPRSSGDAFHVAIFPEESDPGHQMFTNWVFFLWIDNTGSEYNPFGYPLSSGAKIHVTITAYKGVVPYEAAHPDQWAGRTEIPLLVGAKLAGSCTTCDYPDSTNGVFTPKKGAIVPVGTNEIRGTLSWTTKNGEPEVTKWHLAYKSARYPTSRPVFKSATETAGTMKVDFVIKVDPADADQFYSSNKDGPVSQWTFNVDDKADPLPSGDGVTQAYEVNWFLTATAYKDPSYVFGS